MITLEVYAVYNTTHPDKKGIGAFTNKEDLLDHLRKHNILFCNHLTVSLHIISQYFYCIDEEWFEGEKGYKKLSDEPRLIRVTDRVILEDLNEIKAREDAS